MITVAAPGNYGKPRPAVIVQSDHIADSDSVLVCLITSDIVRSEHQRRLTVEPTPDNGLRVTSQIMIEKILAIPRTKCGAKVGQVDVDKMAQINSALVVVLGLLD